MKLRLKQQRVLGSTQSLAFTQRRRAKALLTTLPVCVGFSICVSAEIVSRNPLPRPPIRPNEVFVTRRVPTVVYLKRCVKLLRGPYAKVIIRGAGSCIETAIYVAQDVVAAFGGMVTYSCTRQLVPTAAATSGAVEAVASEASAKVLKGDAFEQEANAKFVAAATSLAALEKSSSAALVSMSAEASSAEAYDEVISLEKGNSSSKEAALEAAGIQQELSVSAK